MTLLNLLGWIGAFCFAVSAFPDTYRALKSKQKPHHKWDLLMLWWTGELCTMLYFGIKYTIFDPVMLNYLFNFGCLCIIIYYKLFGR